MNKIELKLEVSTPIFLSGAYPDSNQVDATIGLEARAASVRGQIRYWMRAILGAKDNDLNHIWEDEENALGSTKIGSQVSVRFYSDTPIPRAQTARVLPHSSEKKFSRPAIPVKHRMTLALVSRPGETIPDIVQHAVRLWLLLGGIGKRSRRMFGAFRVLKWDQQFWGKPQPKTPQEYRDLIRSSLEVAVGNEDSLRNIYKDAPPFATLNPRYSQIFIGNDCWTKWQEAMIYLFSDWLRNNKKSYFPNSTSFGYVDGAKRRASPLIAQLRWFGVGEDEGYYPVFTAMHSQIPDTKPIRWEIISQLMRELRTDLSGFEAWGGELK